MNALTAIGAGASVLGAAGSLFGGGDSGSSIDRETGNQNSANALNFSLMDYLRGQGQNQDWQNLYDLMTGNYTADRSNYETVQDPYTQLILRDIASTGDAKASAQQSGAGIWSALADMLGAGTGTYKAGLADIESALRMSSDVYRPIEGSNLQWLNTTGRGAMEDAYGQAQGNLDTARDYLGKTNDFYEFSKNVVDPEQTATMAAEDVNAQYDKAAAQSARQSAALGMDPSSGASRALDAQRAVDKALAVAGARTQGRVTGKQQQFANMGQGLSAVGQGTSAVNTATGTLGNAAGNLGNFGVSLGNLVRQGPTSLGTSVVSGIGSLANSGANSFSSLLSNPLSAQLAAAIKTIQPDSGTAATLGTTMGKLGADSMSKIYDATKLANQVSTASDHEDSKSGNGFGTLLGGGLGMLSKGLDGSNSGYGYSSSATNGKALASGNWH